MEPATIAFSVGLEIHARLLTTQKIFCTCANVYGDQPNQHVCPVCLGLPGSLPVLNREVLAPALRLAVALGCEINLQSEFSRKNYFYPDLPRNYQITQYEHPLALGGALKVAGRKVRLRRIHLEEDAGRSRHQRPGPTRIDLNRAGAPLVEIVTEPDLDNGTQARQWLVSLRQILRYLKVCDGDLEKGSFRCDANVGTRGGGVLTELKNLNSFKAVAQAVDYETQRLGEMAGRGEQLPRETRAWDDHSRCTYLLRTKEEVADYLYFPEPDLPLLVVSAREVVQVKENLGLLPEQREQRLVDCFGLRPEDAVTLCRSRALADFFEEVVAQVIRQSGWDPSRAGSLAAKWVLSVVLAKVQGQDDRLTDQEAIKPEDLAAVLVSLGRGKWLRSQAEEMISALIAGESRDEVVARNSEVSLVSQEKLITVCRDVLAAHPKEVAAYGQGKTELLNFFVGRTLARVQGKADPAVVRGLLLSCASEIVSGP